jgi:hypothetical protein
MTFPDKVTIASFVWAVGASAIAGWREFRKRQSETLTQRFLVGLKASATLQQRTQIDDELERLKPQRRWWK